MSDACGGRHLHKFLQDESRGSWSGSSFEDPEVPESSGPLLCPEGSEDILICDYVENLLRIFVSISDINKEERL